MQYGCWCRFILFWFIATIFFSLSSMACRIPKKKSCFRSGLIFGNPSSCKTSLFEMCSNLASESRLNRSLKRRHLVDKHGKNYSVSSSRGVNLISLIFKRGARTFPYRVTETCDLRFLYLLRLRDSETFDRLKAQSSKLSSLRNPWPISSNQIQSSQRFEWISIFGMTQEYITNCNFFLFLSKKAYITESRQCFLNIKLNL